VPTEATVTIQLRETFNRVLKMTSAVIASLFICAAVVEWIRSANSDFHGLANYKWVPALRNFFYLMAMFNILLIRYVIMKIYIAPGPNNFEMIIKRLFNANIVSMLISELPCFYGLILFLLASDPIDFYLLFGLSIIYCTIYFPRYKNWVSLLEENLEKE